MHHQIKMTWRMEKGGKKQLIVANKIMKVNEKNHQKPKSDAAMS